MHVGVILREGNYYDSLWRIPHACGGDPLLDKYHVQDHLYSPCMWG